MDFLNGVFFPVRFWRLPRLLFEKVGEIEWVVESQFVGDFFYREVLVHKQSFCLRGSQAVHDVLGRSSGMQLGELVQF